MHSTSIHQISTIFKTITDNSTLSGQKIINVLQERKIAQEQVNATLQKHITQLELDKNALTQLEQKIASGISYEEAYTQSMNKASAAAKEHAIQTKGAAGTTDIFIAKQADAERALKATATSSRLASIGVKILSTAYNMFAGMAVIWAITKITEGFEYLAQSAERAKEKLEEIKTKLYNNSSSYESNRKILVELQSEYDTLSKKAKTLGGVQNLANDEYKRYKEITSQILGITPKLITGWNDEGEAISNKNNLLQASIDLLDEEYEKTLRNNTTKSKNKDVASGIIAKIDEFNNSPDTKTQSGTAYDMRRSFIDQLNNLAKKQRKQDKKENRKDLSYYQHDIAKEIYNYLYPDGKGLRLRTGFSWLESLSLEIIDNDDYHKLAQSFTDKNNPIYNLFSDEVIDDMIRNADAYLTECQRIVDDREALYQEYKDQLNWNAQATKDENGNNAYKQLTDNGKAFINEYINGLDYATIKSEDDFVEMANDVQKFTKLLASDDNVSQLAENIFTSAKEGETTSEYVKRVKESITAIQKYCDDNYIDLNIKFTTLEDVDKAIGIVQNFLKGTEFDDKVGELSLEDLQIAADLGVSEDSIESWDKLISIIEEYKASTIPPIQPFKNITESVDQIKNDLSSAFKELGSAYTDIFEIDSETAEIKFSPDNVNNDMLSGLKETFSELEGFDTSNLEDFFAVLTNGASTADDVQKAFNHLAGAYLYSSEVMDKLNKETAESVAKQLEAMGITNANALVNEALSLKESWVTKAKENNISTTHDLNNATYQEISALKDENGQLDETEQKLYAFWMEKNIVNDTTIDTNADINNLIGLMKASGKACEALTKLYKLKSTLAELDDLHNKGAINTETYDRAVDTTTKLINGQSIKDDFTKQTSNIKDLLADAQKEVSSYYSDFFVGEYNVKFNGGSDYQNKLADARESAAEKQKKDAEKSLQTFDWIETKINNLTDALNRLKDTSDNTYKSWADRSTALANAINTTRQAIDLQQQAYNRYMQEAEKSGLPDVYKNLIQNGAIDISVITDDDLKEKISDYQTWYDKAKNCLEVQEDLKNSLNELNSKKFDNIQSIFDFDISKTEHLLTLLNHQTDRLEMKGLFANESYYNQMLQYTQTKINSLTNERKQLADIMNSSALSQDSEAWQSMYSTLMGIDEEISDLNKDLIEFNNNIRNLNWEIFEYLEESINRITDETEYLINLIANKDLFEDNGNFNKYADATVGLHVTAYDTYKQQAQDYLEEMQDLQKQLVNGAGKDVLEQYNKMVEAHRNAINSANDERKAILDLIEEGYNAQLEAIQKIIDKKKEQMSAEKNLYDYQKTIKEKTDNISSLEKQQAAYAKDDSEETMSKIQQIKVQLEEAKADLKETEYEQYLSDTENMLDELSTDYEEWMNARLDNEDALLSEIVGTVAGKSDEINATLNDVAKEYGTMISDNITSIFNSASPFTNILTNGFNSVSSSIAGTTSAIDRLIAQVAGITNANAGKTNAGSGTSGNGNTNYNSSYGNSAGNINTGSNGYNNGYSNGSNNNSSNSSNTNNNSDGIFIHKADSYPKNKLLKETSIVDRLKYNDFDSSFSARASYYSKLGGSGTYRGSDSQNTWMIQKMKSMGYKKGTKNSGKELAWTQEDGGEIIRTKDGAVLTPLDNSMVFNNESSRKLWEFSQNPTLFMEKLGLEHLIPQFNVKLPDYSSVTQGNVSNEVKIDVDAIDISLPNVTNYKDFRSELIKDNTFTKAIGTYVNNQIMGKNPLEHLKYTGR